MAKADLYAALKALQPIAPLMQSEWFDLKYEEDTSGKDFVAPSLYEACPLTQLALTNELITLDQLATASELGREEDTIYAPLRKRYHVQTRTLDDFVTQWDDWTTPVKPDISIEDLISLVDELANL